MKKNFTKLSVLLAAFMIAFNTSTAQVEEFGMGEVDPYFSAYLKPFGQAMATSLSGGWTHTAEVHKTLGFDITFSGSFVKVPTSEYDINTSGLDMPNYQFTSATVPSIASKDENPPKMARTFNTAGIDPVEFDAIQGGGVNFGGMFAVQAAIGLPKGTELMVRLMPDISKTANKSFESANADIQLEKTNMWGLGVKHDIKQWIPVVSKVPFLQISGLFAYSKFQTGFSGELMRLDPEKFSTATDPNNAELNNPELWDGQKFTTAMSSFTGNLLIGASIPVFQPYIGLGFNSSKFEAGFKGNYPKFQVNLDSSTALIHDYEKDPLTSSSKETNFNFQAGARLKLGFFVFHYTFTAQKYKMHTGGIAFTFR